MQNRLPVNWNDFRVLLAIARGGTLSGAARQLGVDQATISRRLKALEAALQVRLVERLPTETRLTEIGRRVLERTMEIEEVTAQVDRLSMVASQEAPRSLLISAPPVLAKHLLAPGAAALSARLEGTKLTIVGESRVASLSRLEADLAIRLTPGTDGAEILTRAGQMEFGLYAARSYPKLSNPLEWEFIGYTPREPEFEHKRWLYNTIGARAVICEVTDLDTQYVAACSGIGVAGLPCFIADADDRLVALPTSEPMLQLTIWLARHSDRRNDRFIRTAMSAIGELLENRLTGPSTQQRGTPRAPQ